MNRLPFAWAARFSTLSRSQPVPDDQQPPLTVTIGVATSRGEVSADALFDAADQRLWETGWTRPHGSSAGKGAGS